MYPGCIRKARPYVAFPVALEVAVPLDPQFRAVLDALAAADAGPLGGGDAVAARARYKALSMSRRGPGYQPVKVEHVEDTTADGVPVRVYRPAGDPGLVRPSPA